MMNIFRNIAEFDKVNFYTFVKDFEKCFPAFTVNLSEADALTKISEVYNNIFLPLRATKGSAGYDFFAPIDIQLDPGQSVVIPTGIRCKMDEGWVLQLYPRSGLGFKTGVRLANTVGVIDQDYFYADNQGHIMVKLTNQAADAQQVTIPAETGFCQGIFFPYGTTLNDSADKIRTGGFGSTSKA